MFIYILHWGCFPDVYLYNNLYSRTYVISRTYTGNPILIISALFFLQYRQCSLTPPIGGDITPPQSISSISPSSCSPVPSPEILYNESPTLLHTLSTVHDDDLRGVRGGERAGDIVDDRLRDSPSEVAEDSDNTSYQIQGDADLTNLSRNSETCQYDFSYTHIQVTRNII